MKDRSNQLPLSVNSDAYFFEKDKSKSILILGVGNYLMGDEGVGVHLIQRMQQSKLPDSVDLIDGGTGGFLLLGCIEAYRKIIFVDATMDGRPDGTIALIRPKFASDFPSALSVHDVGLKDMIEAIYLKEEVPDMYLLTISISKLTPMTTRLSATVERAIPDAVEQLITLATKLQEQLV